MLELKNIHKDYPAGSGIVHALRGVDLQFRKSEFVSILGPSGCGKTTLLNIIGGLDQYTKGDLVINGKSTKAFKDRDWDGYRNHSVGFVFQNYNLIPHQTVLQNVELALTLSGVSRRIRRQKAAEALEAVGLGDQLRKRPSQLSGGQMQRVAIARALVNNPDIILADEPTGALDSETSVQVMEILKEVAKDRLVVMVTHNPELADAYSTRIIRMLDGKMQSDSMPLTQEELETYRKQDQEEVAKGKKEKKPSMKWSTSFGLSLKNLIAKGGRTTLTSFAGSIGIIGIALIYAVSQGMTTYINTVQEDTLSSYPLTIEASTVDLSSLMAAFMETAKSNEPHENDAVYSKGMLYDLVNSLSEMETTENDLRSFKNFLATQMQQEDGKLKPAINGVQYTYDLDLAIYTESVDGTVIESDAEKLMQQLMSEYLKTDISALMQSTQNSNLSGLMMTPRFMVWQEMLSGDDGKPINDLLTEQYDVIYGYWPTKYDEVVLVVDENNEISDLALYALGLKSEEDMQALMEAADKGTSLENTDQRWTYEEICGMEFRAILPSSCYVLDENTGLYSDIRQTDAGMRYLYDNGLKLKITGVIRPSEDAVSAMLTGTIGYTGALTEYVINQAVESDVVKAQLENPDMDVITGLPFKAEEGEMTNAEKEEALRNYIAELSEAQLADAYVTIMSIPDNETLNMMTQQALAGKTPEEMKAVLVQALVSQMGMSEDTIASYVEDMSDEEIIEYYTEMVVQQVTMQYAAQVKAQLAQMSDMQLAGALTMALPTYTTEQ
ncbi:MAG: ATP-binding cassette domain-containing protein, partial [Oscillospiraceae bacterium]|nr:ATP-binding cassette domain-containing protein [Oscillospiraceae bacterium]